MQGQQRDLKEIVHKRFAFSLNDKQAYFTVRVVIMKLHGAITYVCKDGMTISLLDVFCVK